MKNTLKVEAGSLPMFSLIRRLAKVEAQYIARGEMPPDVETQLKEANIEMTEDAFAEFNRAIVVNKTAKPSWPMV